MHSLRWARSFLLYATIVFTAFETVTSQLACQEPETPTNTTVEFDPNATGPEGLPPPNGGIPQCAAYEGDADVYGYCIYKFAGGFPNVEEVERLCPMAGTWEKECRHAWVSGRMNASSGMDMDFLLKVCAGNPDCTFELIDFRPNPDVVVQMQYCIDHVGPYTRDCIGHAMQRWWYTAPTAEEVARVAAVKSPYPDRLAFYIAASVGCSNIGSCEGDSRMQSICEKNVANYQKYPNRCPSQFEKPMNGSIKPEDLEGKTGQSKPQQPLQKHGPPNPGGQQNPSATKPHYQKPLQ